MLGSVIFLGMMMGFFFAASSVVSGQNLKGKFIWSVSNSRENIAPGIVYFRRTFEAKKIKSGLLEITCDDGYRVYVNGRLVGSNTVWQEVLRYDISPLLVPGKNVIAIHAENASPSPAGLYCKATVNDDKSTQTIISDKSWKFSNSATGKWNTVAFDDSQWRSAREQGLFGNTQPWGNQFKFRTEGVETVRREKAKLKREKWNLVEGDRVVFLGGTFIERMQANDYFESLLTSQFPNLNLTFRNLGWSGDNVFGLSRAVFGNQEAGFRRLENDLLLADPTLVIVNYGLNESFGGPEYLPTFLSGLESLVTLIESNQSDLVFLSPMLLENLGTPLPDPRTQNKNIAIYSRAIRDFANERGYGFIENLSPLGKLPDSPDGTPQIRNQLTENGIHLTPYGYWRAAPGLVKKLGGQPMACEFDFDLGSGSYTCVKSTIFEMSWTEETLQFSAKDDRLVYSPPPEHSPRGGKMMAIHDKFTIRGLKPGRYGLEIEGKPSIMATHQQWADGVLINRGNYLRQPELLRETIVKKNELFFHRHRPQNETYLYLFRKHEQGNNAVEIPRFDPLIANLEKEIANLKKPRIIRYKLNRIVPSDQTP